MLQFSLIDSLAYAYCEQVVGGGGGADIAPAMQAGAPGASLLSEPNNAWLGSGATHTDPATGTMMRSE